MAVIPAQPHFLGRPVFDNFFLGSPPSPLWRRGSFMSHFSDRRFQRHDLSGQDFPPFRFPVVLLSTLLLPLLLVGMLLLVGSLHYPFDLLWLQFEPFCRFLEQLLLPSVEGCGGEALPL